MTFYCHSQVSIHKYIEIMTFLVIRSSVSAGIGWNGMHGGENTFDLKNLRRHFEYPSLPPVDRRRLLSKTSLPPICLRRM